MIGQQIVGDDGKPLEHYSKVTLSQYQPSDEVKKLFARVQHDFQVAWALQHRPFEEFDGLSLLERARLDQQTFAAYVGAEFVPQHKRWRWKGRKNTARNKLIGILAHMIAGMLYPFVSAKNDENEEDKMTARVMQLLVEEHLRKAGYEMQFLFLVLSALANPAVFCGIEYVSATQKIKQRMQDGSYKIAEVVDELLSGLNMNVIPIDEIYLSDFYSGTGKLQSLPYIIRVRRISYDLAKSIHGNCYFDATGKDLFDYVQAGMTKMMVESQQGQTMMDVDWTEADRSFVQELTIYYRSEDLQLTWVGGVGLFNQGDPYNSNPFEHRRMTLIGNTWYAIPVYPVAMSGFEPIDPAGRFAYYKSAAFKEYWDDKTQNEIHRMWIDGTKLDIFKPLFMAGLAKVDAAVIAPGATVGMPMGATVTPYSLGPNLVGAYNALVKQESDMSESTQDKIQNGVAEPGITATATTAAEKNARIILGVFGLMIADLIKQIGELTMDCIVQYETVGDLDTLVGEGLKTKYKTILTKGRENGKNVTHRIMFTDKYMGRSMTKGQQNGIEWKLFEKAGGLDSDQRLYEVNPYQFARYTYTMFVDSDKIAKKSMGTDRQDKVLAFNMLTDPRVAPFTDQQAVVDDLAIDEFGGENADKYKRKSTGPNDMLNSMMMAQGGQPTPSPMGGGGVVVPPVNTVGR